MDLQPYIVCIFDDEEPEQWWAQDEQDLQQQIRDCCEDWAQCECPQIIDPESVVWTQGLLEIDQ